MVIYKCDNCEKEVSELNRFTIIYRHKRTNGESESYGPERNMDREMELCPECTKELFYKYKLKVK